MDSYIAEPNADCVMNNGYSTRYFSVSCGCRQGDPYTFPYTFVLAMEILTQMVTQNVDINVVDIIGSFTFCQ